MTYIDRPIFFSDSFRIIGIMLTLKRNTAAGDVKAGAVYRRTYRGNIVETAKVISIDEDSFGIPHLRFKVCFERPDRKFLEDARVLALETFTRQYCEPLHAA